MSPKQKLGRPPNIKRRERIRKLIDAGKTLTQIARMLRIAPSTTARYFRLLGVEPIAYVTPKPLRRGKRVCVECKQKKTIGAFTNERASTCRMCQRNARG